MSSGNELKKKQKSKRKFMEFAGSDTTTEKLVSKVHVFKSPPMKPEPRFIEYTTATYEGREQLLKRNARVVNRRNEMDFFHMAHVQVHNRIRHDPHLHGNWSLFPAINEENRGLIFRTMAQRGIIAQDKEHTLDAEQGPIQEIPECLKNYSQTYVPPENRIKITSNITFNANDVLPVYSDLPNETIESLKTPSILYDYTDTNFLNKFSEFSLAKAVEMSEQEENTIRCDCCSTESIVNCWENPSCPCYLLNKKMQLLQMSVDDYPTAEFTSFKPLIFSQVQDHFQKHVGFACSELCDCKGNCTNNSLLIPNKKLFPIEIYRSNEKVAFGIRTPVIIPAGTPIFEFCGEVVESNRIERSNSDYAYQISYHWDERWKALLKSMPFTKNYKKLLLKICAKRYFIDPKVYGNVGRTASRGCSANMEVVRIFQKSLSPAHIRLVMVSLVDIYPGTPLTLDYGAKYIAASFDGKCECGTISCPSGKDYHIYQTMNFTDKSTPGIYQTDGISSTRSQKEQCQ